MVAGALSCLLQFIVPRGGGFAVPSQADLEKSFYGMFLGMSDAAIAASTIAQLRQAFISNGPLTQAASDARYITQTSGDARYVRPNTTGKVYTQTYNTASRTVPATVAVNVATTGATNVTPYGFTTAAQPNAIVFQLNTLMSDLDALKQVVTALIDDLQAYGMLG